MEYVLLCVALATLVCGVYCSLALAVVLKELEQIRETSARYEQSLLELKMQADFVADHNKNIDAWGNG